jgi:hypothetical protein
MNAKKLLNLGQESKLLSILDDVKGQHEKVDRSYSKHRS